MPWSNELVLGDEGFHRGSADPWWNEASFISFRVPDRKLLGVLYFYFRPNQNTAMGGPMFADPSGDDFGTCLYNGWDWHMPIPEGADMFDFELDSGFAVKTIEPQLSFRHTYQAESCAFDLTFTADGPPVVMRSDTNVGMATDFIQDVQGAKVGHYEQTGVMNGSLVIAGEPIDVVDAAVIRDRSWGPRRVLTPQRKTRGAYTFGRVSEDHLFHAFTLSTLPWEQDPIVGTSEPVVSGFYVKDGKLGRLVSGARRVLDRGALGRPLREVVEATDEHGRELYAEGELGCTLRFLAFFGDVMTFWCYENWTFDGHRDVPGEVQEWFMCRHLSKWVRCQDNRIATAPELING